ncbi:hypothetical protein ACFPM7_14480 [Actinokineospora guangxiensis]|uniref:DNA-binding protein n=1 Tax=Actinokineospora guangxiensis TaxID=1490288 RepID=A0ABW0ELE4_9PSEU
MSDTDTALIAAGAVLPGTDPTGEDRDVITARSYTHPALDGRVVVRLVPQVLGEAEDLTCEYLGFDAPTSTEAVGTGRRSALGFPAWALINDPANARHALNLVKDVERLARTARSKAGAAKDGFTALGEMLGRSAPHFLPTFYEQAGRIFLEHGNDTYAATMFGKAREAEEVHSLDVDPDRLREVFLEFAFAGALTAKALSAHAKGLGKRYDPAAAHELFLTLCVERTRGGLPPYTGMPEDLRRLAKAAKLDLAAEDERLLRAVLDSSAIDRAGAGFWKSYRAALVRLATADAQIRAALLTFVPDSAAAVELWLGILGECGATEALVAQPAREGDTVVPADWLSSVVSARASGWNAAPRSAELLELVERMGPRMAADGKEVKVLYGRGHELDLLDLLLSMGVPVARRKHNRSGLSVGTWLGDEAPGRRDLAAIAADADLIDPLADGFITYASGTATARGMGTEAVTAAMSTPGLRAALRHWVTAQASTKESLSLPRLTHRLDTLSVARNPEAFVDAPEAAAAIAGTDVARALAATLRTGLLDELGWPALDEAVIRLREGTMAKDAAVEICGEGWPALVLRRGEQFVVVGPDGVLAEHTSRIPADDRHDYRFSPTASWFDGVLLVRWHGKDEERAYWSDAPTEIFTVSSGPSTYYRSETVASLGMPGGGRWSGGRTAHRGDTSFSGGSVGYSDGTTVWIPSYHDDAWRWREVDPATGDRGRHSIPRFIEDFAADGASIDHTASSLRPAAPGTESSPLGCADGMLGWRVRREGGRDDVPLTWVGEGIDGRRVLTAGGRRAPVGLLDVPGARLTLAKSYSGVEVMDAEGVRQGGVDSGDSHPDIAAGTPLITPLAWWHVLRPRDEAGSAALRAVTAETAAALLDAATAEPAEESARGDRAEHAALRSGQCGALATAVAAALPGIADAGLLAGVVSTVRRAARLRTGYTAFGPIAEAARAVDPTALTDTSPAVTEGEVQAALGWFGGYRSHNSRAGARTVLPELFAALVAATSAPEKAGGVPETAVRDWFEHLGVLGAVAHRAASPLTGEQDRAALTLVLRSLVDSGLLAGIGHWRITITTPPKDVPRDTDKVVPVPGGFFVAFDTHWSRNDGYSLEGLHHASTPGDFRLPDGWVLDRATEIAEPFGPARVTAFLDALAEHGPTTWSPEAVTALVEATGMGEADAAVLLAGMPGVDTWGANYLDAAQRKAIGLSAPAGKAARQRFKRLDDTTRRRLLAAAIPADPAELWTSGPDVAAIAQVWIAKHGKRTPVPEDVLVDAASQLGNDRSGELLAAIANPEATAWLTEDCAMRVEDNRLVARNDGGFGHRDFTALPKALLWVAQRLTAGSSMRAQLPRALELLRARVSAPDFALDLGRWNEAPAVCKLLGVELPDEGALVRVRPWLHLVGGDKHHVGVIVHIGLIGDADLPLFTALCEITYDQELARSLELVRSPGLTEACALAPKQDTDPDAFYQDPGLSVPHLVTEVAAHHGIDEDAAALYLQLLALPDPTDANVAKWTGWKPARLRKARAALAETDLVLSAKRARAGRSLFLPGGWLALAKPHLPLERWKAPLFDFTDHPHGAIAPRGTVADLFTRAWRRVLDGDAPAYEQLTTGGRR